MYRLPAAENGARVQTQFDVSPPEPAPGAGIAPLDCARCGTEVTTAWAYCEACGASIRIDELTAALTPADETSNGGPGRNSLALASIVLAVLWIGGLGSLLAVISGRMAKRQIRNRREGGEGLATAGIALGVVGLALAGYLFGVS